MENKKQTAIEWLFEQFNNQDIPFGSYLFKEAKELEKQQIIKAYHDGQVAIFNLLKEIFPKLQNGKVQKEIDLIEAGKEVNEDAEDYYNKTYNK